MATCPIPERGACVHRPETVDAHVRAIELVVKAMREDIRDPLPLREMSRIAHMSLFHFDRVFAEVTGVTPRRFLMALRIQAAKDLLLLTRRSVTEVCLDVGYNSLGTFTTCFTHLVGVSPRHFRRLAAPAGSSAPAPGPDLPDLGVDDGPSRSGIEGCVSATDALPRTVFVGLFPAPIPEGRPVGCALLPRPGPFGIERVPDGRWYAVAAALPRGDDPMAYLLPDPSSLLVGSATSPILVEGGRAVGPVNLGLRRVRPTDPPILMSFLPVPRSTRSGPGADVRWAGLGADAGPRALPPGLVGS